MLELIRNDLNIDFIKLRPIAFLLSGFLTVVGMGALASPDGWSAPGASPSAESASGS